MSVLDWTSLGLNAAGGLTSGLLNYFGTKKLAQAQKEIAEQNLNFQRDALALNQKNQETTWAREDNAVQRRVADLEAAGMSKTLAAGSAASSSAPMKVESLHNDYKPIDYISKLSSISQAASEIGQTLYGLKQMGANIEKTKAETELLNSQSQNVKSQNNLNIIEGEYRSEYLQNRINHLVSDIQKNKINSDYLSNLNVSEDFKRKLYDAQAYYWKNIKPYEGQTYFGKVGSDLNKGFNLLYQKILNPLLDELKNKKFSVPDDLWEYVNNSDYKGIKE